MNCNKVLLIAVSLFGLNAVQAQNILNAKSPEEMGIKDSLVQALENDTPLPYGYVNESRDVLWSTTTWEIIDLEQRANFPLYYPTEDNLGSERRSLFNVLISAIESEEIENIYGDSYFRTKITLEEVKEKFVARDLTPEGFDIKSQNAYLYPDLDPVYELNAKLLEEGILTDEHFDIVRTKSEDVTQYRIRGYWYVDARQGELKYRLLGICPMAPNALSKLRSPDEAQPVELFWIFYPDARKTLHNSLAFNAKNSASPFNFDQLLNARRFVGHIYKEENVYGDRQIEEYIRENAQNQLLEAERIKERIRDIEQDLWNY